MNVAGAERSTIVRRVLLELVILRRRSVDGLRVLRRSELLEAWRWRRSRRDRIRMSGSGGGDDRHCSSDYGFTLAVAILAAPGAHHKDDDDSNHDQSAKPISISDLLSIHTQSKAMRTSWNSIRDHSIPLNFCIQMSVLLAWFHSRMSPKVTCFPKD